jgi:hypothetical protein
MPGWIRWLALALAIATLPGCKKLRAAFKKPSSASASANASAAPTPKEAANPKGGMTRAAADAAISAVLVDAAKPNADCKKLTAASVQAALDLVHPDAAFYRTNEKAMVALARCAEQEHAYLWMLRIANALVAAKPDDDGHPELVARALLGLGDTASANKLLVDLVAKRPTDPNLVLTLAKSRCRSDDYKDCLAQANAALKLVTPPKDAESKDIAWRAQKYRGRSLLHLSKFAEASAAADQAVKLGAPASVADEIKKDIVPAKATKAIVQVEMSDHIPLGGYHLFGKVPSVGSVVDVKVFNLDTSDRQMKVEASIDGTTSGSTQTVTVLKGAAETVHLNPPLKPDYKVADLRADAPSQLVLRVTRLDGAKESVVYDQSRQVTVMPRDTLPLARFFDRDHALMRWTPEFLGAWMTPNAKAMDEFLASAKKRLAAGQSFSGGQSATLPQVKAIYDELQARGMSYVMDPRVLAHDSLIARTRLPSEVLRSTNAQCLEGTILYATLLEAIGLRPIVVLVPSHAFLAWYAESHDPNAGQFNFLETTLTHAADFDHAVSYAQKEYELHRSRREFDRPANGGEPQARMIDVAKLRAVGVTPQPWE